MPTIINDSTASTFHIYFMKNIFLTLVYLFVSEREDSRWNHVKGTSREHLIYCLHSKYSAQMLSQVLILVHECNDKWWPLDYIGICWLLFLKYSITILVRLYQLV